ncbi:hypothetical protein D043_4881B, partial [Vibrio parahaemolyticus EKP-021]
GYALHR